MKTAKILVALVSINLMAPPLMAETTLGPKDTARVNRAPPEERADVEQCLLAKKKGAKKGAIIGTAAGAGTSLIFGGNVGETLLGAGAGALAGNLLGKGTSTNKYCDDILKRNK